MIFAHANLGRGVTTREFTTNLRKILDAWGPRAVYAFQEIDEADAPEEHDILASLTAKTHTIVGGNTAVPILVPRQFDVLVSRLSLGCHGLAKFTPNRPVNEVVLHVGPNLSPGILNFHIPLDREQTQTRRAQMRRNVKARARRYEAGLWVADTNTRSGWPEIVPGERSVTDAGIDKAKAWAAPGRKVVVSDRRTVRLSIDGHNAHGARVRWEKR